MSLGKGATLVLGGRFEAIVRGDLHFHIGENGYKKYTSQYFYMSDVVTIEHGFRITQWRMADEGFDLIFAT